MTAVSESSSKTEAKSIVHAICPYCGVGCGINYHVIDNRIVKGVGAVENPVNKGKVCVKGILGYDYTAHPDRLTIPLIRKDEIRKGKIDLPDKKSAFREATWDEALSYVAKRLRETMSRYGGHTICALSSAKVSNEENYVLQKFIRTVFRTNNIDYCTRLCHSTTVYALMESLGSAASTNSIADISDSEVIIIAGSNTTENHPVIAAFISEAVLKGTKLIVIDTRRTGLCGQAYIHIQNRPGTDVALLNGIAHVIVNEGLYNKEFIANRTEGFDEYIESLSEYTPEFVERLTGVDKDKIIETARLYATAKAANIFVGMGMSQHSTGTDNNFCLINLVLLTGHIGKRGAGLNPLRGQNNVQGASDVGCLPFVYPGYQSVEDEQVRKTFEKAWGVELNPKMGLTVTEMMESALEGKVKAMYIMGENPALSDPNLNKTWKALESFEFMVVQDIFLTETAEYADVILPAASNYEKDGSYVNTERRVQYSPKVVDPPGQAKADWEIICELSSRLGYPMSYKDTAEILEEIAQVTPIMAGIRQDRIRSVGIQWPVPTLEHSGTTVMFAEKFPRGRGKFFPASYKLAAEEPDKEYPDVLNTGRILEHWHTGTMTRRSKALTRAINKPFVEMSVQEAEKTELKTGDMVKVSSRRGEITLAVKVSKRIAEGSVFIPFHFKEAAANVLTNDARDPFAKMPEFKVCAVKIQKIIEPVQEAQALH